MAEREADGSANDPEHEDQKYRLRHIFGFSVQYVEEESELASLLIDVQEALM